MASHSTTDKMNTLEKLQTDFETQWFATPTSTTSHYEAVLQAINELRGELGLETYSPPPRTPERNSLPDIPPPPPLRRVNAFTSANYEPTDEDDLMNRLRIYRAELQIKQDNLYTGVMTDEQIAAVNEQYEEMNRKIYAIENLMLTCGAIFRTR
jgi:hypothetical protein